MKRHPLLIEAKKAEIARLEKAAAQATNKDEYMRLRVLAHRIRKSYGIN